MKNEWIEKYEAREKRIKELEAEKAKLITILTELVNRLYHNACQFHELPEKVKPPLGIKPRWLVDEQRLAEIKEAIHRFLLSREVVPQEWFDERDSLEISIGERKYV